MALFFFTLECLRLDWISRAMLEKGTLPFVSFGIVSYCLVSDMHAD